MRFRKSFTITKGVKVNLSKTGASVTVGKGPVSLNLGTKGAYVNWSVPGTGVYDRVRIDKFILDKLGISKSKTAKAEAAVPGVADEELERLALEQAFYTMHEQAPDVEKKADKENTFDEETVDNAVEEWLEGAEAPVPFTLQTQAVPEARAIMVDLDLPEIEDMPTDKLAKLSDGTTKIKTKTKKEQKEGYVTCVFGLGVYVAANVLSLVPQAERVLVSAYTQREDSKTKKVRDMFIYSVVFERSKFNKNFQKKDPQVFCDTMVNNYKILSTGEMKEIEPMTEGDLAK